MTSAMTTRDNTDSPEDTSRLDTSVKLHTSHEVPSWYAHNAFHSNRLPSRLKSITLCIRSLLYLHNETVNIYSHLLPALAILLASYSLDHYFTASFPQATWTDELVFRIFLTTSVVCFGTSAAYHTLICHSEGYASLWVRADYVAIIGQIVGSFIPGIYFGFYCEPGLQKAYWSMIITLGTLTATTVINPSLQGPRWKIIRLSTFIATGFSAFAPISHGALLFPYDQLDRQTGLRYYYLEGILILLGVGFYATHCPESCKPKRYDIWGASHQLFHVFIVLSAVAHWYGIMSAMGWNYVNQRCQWS